MQITIVFITLLIAVVLFITEILPIDLVAVLMLLPLALTKVLTPEEALSGFSDQAVITIAAFFVISAALFNTGVVEAIGHRLHSVSGSGKSRLLAVTMLTAAAIAAFMSNLVTTAVLMPAVIGIARRIKQPASQFLMPLAFGAVLGGKCTLVGSPTNLAVSGLMAKYHLQPFGLFEFTPLGVPILIAGVVYMILVGTRLLPRHDLSEFAEGYRLKDYLTEVVVRPESPLTDKTLEQTDFRGTYDLQILKFMRGGRQQLPRGDTRIASGDVLLVKGKLEKILSIKDAQGLDIKSDKASYDSDQAKDDTVIVEAILAPNSRFVGRTLKQIRFGTRYGADILAIYRHHKELNEKLSDIRLEFGDVLVIQGTSTRINDLRHDPNFLTLEDVQHTPLRKNKAMLAVVIFLAAAVLAGFSLAPIALIALGAAAAMLLFRCMTIQEAYGRIEWTAIVLIAATIPMGLAMEKTGAAKLLADYVTRWFGFGGPLVVLGAFFVFTVFLTQPMANAAAGLLITPIAINVANQLHANPRAFAITIAIAASCSFPTPLEPVCAIVYGPGKYRFADYVRVGGPLTLLVMIVALLVVPIFWPL